MDLSKIVAQNNDQELIIPGHGGTGFFVSLRHESSPEVQKVNKQFQNKIAEDARKGGRNRSNISEWYKNEKAAAHIAGWRWEKPDVNINGEQPQYSPEKALELLKGNGVFAYCLRQLIDDNVTDDESFLAKSV